MSPKPNGQAGAAELLEDGKLALLLAWYEELPHEKRREFWQMRASGIAKIAWLMGEAMRVKRNQLEVIQ